jgi:adenylate cyclase
MSTGLAALTRLRLARLARILALSALIGGVYGVRAVDSPSPVVGVLVGAVNGGLIAAAIAGIEIFALRGRALRPLARLPFALLVALKTLVYGAIAAAVLAARLGERLAGTPSANDAADLSRMVGFSLLVTLVFVVVLQAAGLVGYATFRSLLLGRYREPHAERRFFLFVDLVGSTAAAERLGPLAAHRFLASVFATVAEPIAAAGGEIYQYVGDEIVVTWLQEDGARDGRALRCFLAMREALARRAGELQARFGVAPELRAALHAGEVVAGEVGEERRAIVFHGDVMNAAARLEQATRELGCRFLVSDDALRLLGAPSGLALRDVGPLPLRGRREPLRAFAADL